MVDSTNSLDLYLDRIKKYCSSFKKQDEQENLLRGLNEILKIVESRGRGDPYFFSRMAAAYHSEEQENEKYAHDNHLLGILASSTDYGRLDRMDKSERDYVYQLEAHIRQTRPDIVQRFREGRLSKRQTIVINNSIKELSTPYQKK